MTRRVVGALATVTLALAVALALAATPAGAQVRGLPVYNNGIPRGIGLYGDVGFPNADAGKGVGYGATGRLGLGPIGATATLAGYDPEGPVGSGVGVGGTLDYKVFGGPLIPLSVTLQGGVGYADRTLTFAVPGGGELESLDGNELHVPVGVGFALVIPNPVLAVQPWLAPRLDINRVRVGGASSTETNFGLSGGVELNFLSGLGVHAAYDVVFADADRRPGVFGIGAHYTFRIPGL
jgi:hypothetical protein